MRIAVVDYGMGNLRSVSKAIERVAPDAEVLVTAQPNIVGEFGSQQNIAWIFTGYLLTQTIATPILGKLSDIFGRKDRQLVVKATYLLQR